MLGVELDAAAYLARLSEYLQGVSQGDLCRWSDALVDAWQANRFVFIIGNGGSGTSASHMSEDLGKSTLPPNQMQDESCRRLKVMSLTDNVGWLLAVANDIGYEDVFVQQLMNFGDSGDLLIAISGSGNSPNILKAVDWANRHGLRTFGLSGFDGGKLKQIQQDGVHVPVHDMGMAESIHLSLFHWVLNDVYARVHRQGRYRSQDGVSGH